MVVPSLDSATERDERNKRPGRLVPSRQNRTPRVLL